MKCKYLLTLVGIAAMLASCNKEEPGGLDNSPTTTKSFTVNVDNGVNTRAVTPPAEAPTRYVMEVYKGAETMPVSHTEQATGVFENVQLDNGETYTALFWADYGTPSTDGSHPAANEYDAANLKAVKVAKQPTAAAFAGTTGEFTVGTTAEGAYTSVTLTHAVAMVNFVQTEALTSATNTLTVNYPKSYSLNVADNAVTEIAGEVTHTFSYFNAVAGTLGTSYIIAATVSGTQPAKTVLGITAALNGETSKTIGNVPFERNYRTNIQGAYSNKQEVALTVTCEADWGTPDNDKPLLSPLKVGDYYPAGAAKENAMGVVFWVDPNNAGKGKIVSMDEGNLQWSTENATTSATDRYDGAKNTTLILNLGTYSAEVYPAVAWCVAKGDGWYLPARSELGTLYGVWKNNQDGFNAKLTTGLSVDNYAASTEASSTSFYTLHFNGSGNFTANKTESRRVRAVFAF